MAKDGKKMRIAATADVHYGKHSKGKMQELFTTVSREADVLLMCGDLTDYGLPEEAELLAADIRSHLRIPVIGVLGNHDFESAQQDAVTKVMEEAGVEMLDGESVEIDGVGFAGVCGFGGGFGRRMLNAWGEPLIKTFVQEAIDQALRLERALTKLPSERRIVLLHYAPIRATVEGEPPEIFPFLGSTRLEEPINRFRVSACFHGHAHNGTAEGATATNVPTFNVAAPLLQKHTPDKEPFRLFEI
ncbi:MAG TPA: metallophosphoesterase [Chthoniobacterales bacterium]|nr:metallophosphoesterase [Chthoniobacterales bacterium]